VQGIYSYNYDSGKADYEPESYTNIFCKGLAEARWMAYQQSGQNLGMKLEEPLRADRGF